MSADKILNVVVGTAGHIDHGKSSLVRHLTGTNPDRLKEEQERGLTIDLGFAAWDLPDGRKVGIVDVPGHERFVKNMVAGATGIDLVMLVVAADDGVMPQTREHLEIMQLLGIQRGLVAVTKIDLVDPDLLEIVIEDTQDFLADTFLGDAPLVPVSVISGEGTELLHETLITLLEQTEPRTTDGLFRMPIQRVFSAKGFGTVVTGIPVSGMIRKGDELEIMPLGKQGRVRGIQAYRGSHETACAGHSAAINLSDVDFHSVHRGMVLASPGYFEGHSFFEARLRYLGSAKKPLVNHTAIRFHTGTIETLGRVYLLEQDELAPGEEALVQLRLDEPVVAAAGDAYVIRLQSPIVTIGGGTLVGVSEYRLKRKRDWIVDRVRQKVETLDSPRKKAELLVLEAGAQATNEAELKKRLQLPELDFRALIKALKQDGILIKLQAKLVHREVLADYGARLIELLDAFHQDNPKKMYCDGIELRNALRIEPVLFERIISGLADEGALIREGGKLRQKGLEMTLSDAEQELYQSLLIVYRDKAFQTPRPDQLPEILDTPQPKIEPMLALAVEQGDLVRLDDRVLLARANFERAMDIVVEDIQAQGELISADFRDKLNTTRKYVIPLLDYFDKIGLTTREGSQRILRREYAKALEREKR